MEGKLNMDISINKLSEITAKSRRTIKSKILKAGLKPVATGATGNPVFDSRELLPLLYDTPDVEIEKPVDFATENVRLIKEKADSQSMKNAELRSKLIPASEVSATWQRIVKAAFLQFKDLPDRLAPMLESALTAKERRVIIEKEIKGALESLADGN